MGELFLVLKKVEDLCEVSSASCFPCEAVGKFLKRNLFDFTLKDYNLHSNAVAGRKIVLRRPLRIWCERA